MTSQPTQEEERPGRIDAVEVRHPWRWVVIAVIAVLVLMLAHLLLTNSNFNWPFTLEVMNQTIVIRGFLVGTLFTTVCAMVIGIVGGVLLAILRLSDNKVLAGVAWTFTWFFRAVPRYVLLSITGGLGALFATGLSVGIPFDFLLAQWFGTPDLRLLTVSQTTLYALFGGVFGGIVGLGVSEAAYMAEISRAGLLSVDRGQHEAAEALGMSRGLAMRRVVLPQAMRVIVPPTGNEVIAMLKDTSLLAAIPVQTELFFRVTNIKNRTFEVMAGNMAAVAYYLIATSVLMVGQYFLEKRFSRGYGGNAPQQRPAAAGVSLGPGGAK
ncbi:amino acid ABC transporter permease [Kineococcus rhizosphaerae]|uniref:Polar amino acid transport system permease protein n=1 Tax=Kineococcus rhizosphaerae TaxID=559628 RepID=A0A2T0QZ29_9ACTN|nr:amino acid ABC transporter permease [Kineococcus rhizosphaerae]PRY11706.1 polar amino acid transport system permease protein [Kineococcus rhizosphaerae]